MLFILLCFGWYQVYHAELKAQERRKKILDQGTILLIQILNFHLQFSSDNKSLVFNRNPLSFILYGLSLTATVKCIKVSLRWQFINNINHQVVSIRDVLVIISLPINLIIWNRCSTSLRFVRIFSITVRKKKAYSLAPLAVSHPFRKFCTFFCPFGKLVSQNSFIYHYFLLNRGIRNMSYFSYPRSWGRTTSASSSPSASAMLLLVHPLSSDWPISSSPKLFAQFLVSFFKWPSSCNKYSALM